MPSNIYPFRRIKWAAPQKLKVLAEDLRRKPWIERLSSRAFTALAIAVSATVSILVFVGGLLLMKA